ncbi:MAG: radical SAM protein [bacterium]
MPKIVLATAPRAKGDLERAGLPFLGLGYVAAVLERAGHEIKVVDAHTEDLSIAESVDRILEHQPAVVGLTATTNNRFPAIGIIRELKKRQPRLFIMVGGPHFTLTAIDALTQAPEIDCVVCHEGEITVVELMSAWPDKAKFKDIPGLVYRDENGEIRENAFRPFTHRLDDLPFPAWHLFPMEKYWRPIDMTNINTVGVISSRGCPNHCVYCCNAAFGKAQLRLRDPVKFVDELEYMNKKYHYQGFNIWDDTMTVVKSHVLKICEEIIRRKLNIKWYARARVNTVDEEMLKAMKSAGCIRISYGVESGSPQILKIIKKNITPEQALKAVKLTAELGIGVSVNFMVSLPYESWDDLKMTADLIKELKKIKDVSPAYGFTLFYPGTEMEAMGKKEGWLPTDFSWNSPFKSKKYKVASVDSSLPYLEMPEMPLEKIKALMSRELMGKGDLWQKGWQKLKKVRSLKELASLGKVAKDYLKIRK